MRRLALIVAGVLIVITTCGHLAGPSPATAPIAAATPAARLAFPLIAVARPTPTPTPAPISSAALELLARVNQYRAAVGLPAVEEDPALSDGARKHAMYMILNWGEFTHQEDPARPGYSPEGDHAARNSNLAWGFASPAAAVDGWMAGVYHRIWITNPKLQRIGIGWAVDGGRTAAVLDVIDGMVESTTIPYPVAYPAAGMTGVPTRFDGGETPDPLATCPGYQYPVGYIVSLQFEMFQQPATVTTAELRDAASALVPTCLKRPDEDGMYNTVALIPTAPLQPNSTYTVLIAGAYRGTPFTRTWQFITGGTSSAATTTSHPDRPSLGPAPIP